MLPAHYAMSSFVAAGEGSSFTAFTAQPGLLTLTPKDLYMARWLWVARSLECVLPTHAPGSAVSG